MGRENHGNLSPIMAIMVQNLPPSHSHPVIPRLLCHSERSEEPPPSHSHHVIPCPPCHSEHSEESLTSFSRRRESRVDGTGKSWQSFPHHGNHGSKPPPFAFTPRHSVPSMSFRAQRGISNVILAKARIQRGLYGKIMAIIPPSWQSCFKNSLNPPRIAAESH